LWLFQSANVDAELIQKTDLEAKKAAADLADGDFDEAGTHQVGCVVTREN
jgi:hypothetical protein